MCELTCTVTPAEPHMFQREKLHSALYRRLKQPAEWLKTIDTLDYGGQWQQDSWKKPNPSAKVFTAHPHNFRALPLHATCDI
ncbi:hypothetical protein EYF80_057573 [Liparis tanakae]|uniref:Uncharacterized protein n=1 Tax=Liparis tanakae TaxID=230148 RepID=A0A4Z2ETZ5_9TELE|nr:hypothetical protein EYF80_057573 [Liparis tanakae]